MASEQFAELNRRLSSWEGRLAFVGTGKNAGKTTVLKHVLRLVQPNRAGLTSIGRDGEPYDVLEMHEKPRIGLRKGMRIATAESCLAGLHGQLQVEETTSAITPLGAVLIARVEQPCEAEVAGPSTMDELGAVVTRMHQLGSRLILIDGAFGRMAAGSAARADAVIVASGSAGKNRVEEAAADLQAVARCFQLPLWPRGANGTPAEVLFRKSITSDGLSALSRQTVVLPSPAGCLLDSQGWRRLDALEIRLFVEKRPALMGLFVSGFRPHLPPLPAVPLLEACRRLCPELPIFNLALEGALLE